MSLHLLKCQVCYCWLLNSDSPLTNSNPRAPYYQVPQDNKVLLYYKYLVIKDWYSLPREMTVERTLSFATQTPLSITYLVPGYSTWYPGTRYHSEVPGSKPLVINLIFFLVDDAELQVVVVGIFPTVEIYTTIRAHRHTYFDDTAYRMYQYQLGHLAGWWVSKRYSA